MQYSKIGSPLVVKKKHNKYAELFSFDKNQEGSAINSIPEFNIGLENKKKPGAAKRAHI